MVAWKQTHCHSDERVPKRDEDSCLSSSLTLSSNIQQTQRPWKLFHLDNFLDLYPITRRMCLPCFPWTWSKYEDPFDGLHKAPEQSVWVHDGQRWELQKVVRFTDSSSQLFSVTFCFGSICLHYLIPFSPLRGEICES